MKKGSFEKDKLMHQISFKVSRRIRELVEEETISLYEGYNHSDIFEYDAYKHAICELTDVRRDLILSEYKIETVDEKDMVRLFAVSITDALTNLYYETQEVIEKLNEVKGLVWIEPQLFISEEYPSTFQDQTERAKKFWEIMLDKNIHILYNNGYSLGCFEADESLNHFLYLNEVVDNWYYDIVGLFGVKIPDLVMPYAAHDMASHMHFTIFDLMHVRKFKSIISIEIRNDNERSIC